MKKRLRVLHVEDNPLDAQLIARAFADAGYDVHWLRAETEAEYESALAASPEVVIADYHLPQFTGLRALEILKRAKLEIPFILVSGTVGEEKAVEAIRLGADDYLLKDRLGRLSSAVERALERLADKRARAAAEYYDPLTGLPNRALFHERLKVQLQDAGREQGRIALLILDIERFRTINETLGRQAGDAILQEIANRVRQGLQPSNWVARIGADHFAIVVPGLATEGEVGRRIEERLDDTFAAPFTSAGAELRLSARIGIALFPHDSADADTLLRNAEAAVRKAKATGERYLFYTQEMTERIAESLSLENKLRQAVEKEEFVLHYQPKVELKNRAIVGVEALIRWQSPELGLVPPGKFIFLLEETGLILQVGSWALRRAALDHRAWVEQGLQAPRVAVNVSQIQLRRRDFVRVVEEAVLGGIAPTGIDLEITESLVMQDIEANIEKLKAVRGLGIKIAIDDFGTGYSSLAYLAKLPVETLKIDRSFITSMLEDPNTTTLIQTVISLAHSLKLKVVAEGVEREEQAKMLHLLGCDQMQGFVFSKPLPVQQLIALLKAV
ncbi:MAG: diguanylate cyclase [Betaproteobacteria bacterium]|nr:diguanylate cyclase [Betaproteobacteria bacterium]